MRSEQQHIDDFIRNKTDEFHPDQQGLQPNWQQMQKMLVKPGPKFKITKSSKLIKYVGGIAVVTIITITAIQFNNKKKAVTTKKAESKTEFVASKRAGDLKVTDKKNKTIETRVPDHDTKAVAVVKPKTGNKTPQPSKAHKAIKQDVPKTVTLKPGKRTYDDKDQIATVRVKSEPQKKKVNNKPEPLLILEQFYAELKKTPEEFIIYADRDTVLKAKEGTVLKIPSNSFSKKTGTVKIILTEFYQDDDIVTEKLSTTSNGNQLVTGGMLNIHAEADGQPVNIAPDKKITIEMPTKNYDEKMQLFTGSFSQRSEYSYKLTNDRSDSTFDLREEGSPEMINWIPAGQYQSLSNMYSPRTFKVPDIAGEPYKVKYGKKKITATFLISHDLKMSNREVKEKLKRYSLYYDVIKVRRLMFGPNFPRFNKDLEVIKGDSIVMKFESALRLKMVSKEDSIRWRQLLYRDSIQNENRRKYLSNYTFETRSLGWINCDRMLNSPGLRIEFTINLGEGVEAGNFVTQLVFDNYRSMMQGFYSGNKVQFRSVPLDEPVHLVAVGVIDGKVVSCIKSMTTTKEEVSNLALEETTSDQFKKNMKELIKTIPR